MHRDSQPRRPLLRQINGQPTYSSLPQSKPVLASKDVPDAINAESRSSDDEQAPSAPPPAPKGSTAQEPNRRVYPGRNQTYTKFAEGSVATTGKQNAADVSQKKGYQSSIGKRSGGSTIEDNGFLNMFGEMDSTRNKKRAKVGGKSTFQNVHVVTQPKATYGAKNKTSNKSAPGFKHPSPAPTDSPKSKQPVFKTPAATTNTLNRESNKAEFKQVSEVLTSRTTRPEYNPQSKPISVGISKISKMSNMPKFLVPEKMDDFFQTLQDTTSTTFQKPCNASESSSSLSSPDSSIIVMSSQARSEHLNPDTLRHSSPIRELSPEPGSICPMCRKPVNEMQLYTFSVQYNFKLNVRLQEIFCREHKQKSAADEYAARGYPKIMWHELEEQMEQHTPRLEAVLDGRETSAYRDRLEHNVRTGSNRNLLSGIMTEEFKVSTTGYYGARGARVMMEYITKTFAPQIRRLAPTDKAIASGGMSKFVQSVLLPELVIRLVMEDMEVGEERAKEIIKESGEIGDLVHEEDDDAVRRDEFGNMIAVLPDSMESDDGSNDDDN